MKSILMIATAFMLSISANANVTPENGEPSKEETVTRTMTIADLKAQYGMENIEFEGLSELSNETLVQFVTKVGPPCDGAMPCGGAMAQARHDAQVLANSCCCIQISGVECCDKGTFKAILFLVEPNSPHCN